MTKLSIAILHRKTFTLLICTSAILMGTNACSEQANEQAQAKAKEEQQTTAPVAQTQELKQEWSEAIDAVKNYSASQRDQAIKQAQQTLTTMDNRIDKLDEYAKQEWEELSESMRQSQQASLQTMRQQRNDLAEWYGGMKHSSAESWDSVKQGFIEAYGVLDDTLEKAKNQFESSNKSENKS